MLAVSNLLYVEVSPHQFLPRGKSVPLQYRTLSKLIDDALHVTRHVSTSVLH